MRSKTVAQLPIDLGLGKTHSRPYTATDTPDSEAQFKTMKYRPDYPDRFGSQAEARAWARTCLPWCNHQHRHSSLGLPTPAVVHHGHAQAVQAQGQQVLGAAFAACPERFVRGRPTVHKLPDAV